MLIFNPKRVMAMRGIDRMFNFLHTGGFIRSTASYILGGTASHIKIEHIGKLCVMLNCTPNDLFEWKKDSNTVLSADHALNSIIRESKPPKNLTKLINDIPLEKIPEIEDLLKGLKDS